MQGMSEGRMHGKTVNQSSENNPALVEQFLSKTNEMGLVIRPGKSYNNRTYVLLEEEKPNESVFPTIE
jgi:hypothetical protein